MPRIGPVMAGRIVEYRESHGPFRKLVLSAPSSRWDNSRRKKQRREPNRSILGKSRPQDRGMIGAFEPVTECGCADGWFRHWWRLATPFSSIR
ncbi:MAG: ComEA family DNA-binding protein [Anaerolineae bacterium]